MPKGKWNKVYWASSNELGPSFLLPSTGLLEGIAFSMLHEMPYPYQYHLTSHIGASHILKSGKGIRCCQYILWVLSPIHSISIYMLLWLRIFLFSYHCNSVIPLGVDIWNMSNWSSHQLWVNSLTRLFYVHCHIWAFFSLILMPIRD